MGENKAFIRINGERIIDRTIRIFRELFQEIVLVTNEPLAYLEFDVKIVTDIVKGKAALGGSIPAFSMHPASAPLSAPATCPF